MINTDHEALICDLAETYQIYEYRGLPLNKVAVLSAGLRHNSRIKQKIMGIDYSIDVLLQGMMVDSLNFIAWSKTEDAQHNENRPQKFLNILLGKEDSTQVHSFASGAEFEEMRNKILRNDELWQQN